MKKLSLALSAALGAWLVVDLAAAAARLGTPLEPDAEDAQRDVIVILRDQMPALPALRRDIGVRSGAIAHAHRQLAAAVPQLLARRLKSFSTINAFATRLTAEEARQLAQRPDVQAVVNDRVIQLPKRTLEASVQSGAATPLDPTLCNTLEPEALQLTHAAFASSATPQAQLLRDAKGQLVTGQGVKVAFIADGIETAISGFTRPDGSSVFIDYQDFSGDPAGTPTGGAEAFIDASAIAAQDMPRGKLLQFDLAQYVNPAHPLPAGCNIHIRGMAPGASLVGLKVFGQIGYTSESTLVQAIEYAIQRGVDVINESFGTNPLPSSFDSPVDLANQQAVRAGIVVTVSTGDAGSDGTLSEESSRAGVIAVGSTTSYRLYAQTGDGVMPLLAKPAWLSNNISPVSSGGFAQAQPRTVDVVAPGDLGWTVCSSRVELYQECLDESTPAGNWSPIQAGGGTSQAAPFTAGVAALVIQAYRSTHHGQDPTPALVKSLIMSSATDLGAPGSEQGAGLLNAYAAVTAALSIDQAPASLKGSAFLVEPSSAGVEAAPGSLQTRTFTLTNTSSTTQHLKPTLEVLNTRLAGEQITLNLDAAHAPTFRNAIGNGRAYLKRAFNVPATAEHLDVAVAFKSPAANFASDPPALFLALIDPQGRQAAYSAPQGLGSGYAHVDVVAPQAGSWTAVLYTRVPPASGAYTGPLKLTWEVQKHATLGSVSPSDLTLPPGAHADLIASFAMPAQAGDLAAAVRFDASPGAATQSLPAIPLVLRTLVPLSAKGGAFSGMLTGGNGREGTGPVRSFAFDVPAGHSDIALSLKITDPGYLLEGVLVDPQGMQMSVAPNLSSVSTDTLTVLDAHHFSPQAGRWRFMLLQNLLSSGSQAELPFDVQVSFDSAVISAPTLPNNASTKVSASHPLSVPVKIKNTTQQAQMYFADARLDSYSRAQLPLVQCSPMQTLPGGCGAWLLPTQVQSVTFTAQASRAIQLSAYNVAGNSAGITFNPFIAGKTVATNTQAAILGEPEIPWGVWIADPALIGPYGASGTPTASFETTAVVQMRPFDQMLTADSGDYWADVAFSTNTFAPLILEAGASGVINLKIAPTAAQAGKVVSGYVFIDTFNSNVSTGDEWVRLPYRYTVVP